MNSSVFALAVLMAGCSSASPPPAAQPAPWTGDTILAPLLNAPVLTRAELAKADTIASQLGEYYDDRLGAIAEDTLVPTHIRTKALFLLSQRSMRLLDTFIAALADRDERVRTAAVAGLQPAINRSSGARQLVTRALRDPSPMVQTKALEVLGDVDASVLREMTASSSNAGVRKIALDLLMAAEDRGAPLAEDSAHRLTRLTATGHTIQFVPVQSWPNWKTAVGALYVAAPKKTAVKIADGVEVVNRVVPAFITPDSSRLVYEADRQIHVYDLRTGTSRTIGEGIAPRLLPYTQSFIYLRAVVTTPEAMGSKITYQVMRVNADGAHTQIGEWVVKTTHEGGNASPARWMRVREISGSFFLTTDNNELYQLPNPFGT